MKWIGSTSTIALVLVACAGGGSVTTSTPVPSTTSSSTVTSITVTDTTAATAPSTSAGPPGTLPPVIAETVFAFAGGLSAVRINVSVGDSPDGPWQPAGPFVDTVPFLGGASYWLRFDIENIDELGNVVELDISGDIDSDLGPDVCDIELPLPIGGSGSCVVGDEEGLPVAPGGETVFFVVTAESEHQGFAPDRWFDPMIPDSLEYDRATHGFLFLFDGGGEEGVRIEGVSDGPEVEVDLSRIQLSAPVRVDCSDEFEDGFSEVGGSPTPGEPAVAAYVISSFSASGDREDGCGRIPTERLPMDLDGDDSYTYFAP